MECTSALAPVAAPGSSRHCLTQPAVGSPSAAQTSNVVWKKNRNAFARLLLEQLRSGRLAEPFHQMPPDGPLPTLPKHAAYAFAPQRAASPTGRREQQQQPDRR